MLILKSFQKSKNKKHVNRKSENMSIQNTNNKK